MADAQELMNFRGMRYATFDSITHAGRAVVCAALCLLASASIADTTPTATTKPLVPLTFQFHGGGSATYYSFVVGASPDPDTAIFFYGGSGCRSWGSVMPDYTAGLIGGAHVFALNKRFVPDKPVAKSQCGRAFHLANNPRQWVADHSEFIAARLKALRSRPRNVVVVGVSEGAWPATLVAEQLPSVTHLAIIGDGAYSMRRALTVLRDRNELPFDIDTAWKEILLQPRSITKTWLGNPYRWWFDIMDYDPLPHFLSLDIPILVGMGSADDSVPVESVLFLAEQFRVAGKSNLTLMIYPDADHRLMTDSTSYRRNFFSTLSTLLP
jgi:pimeloyl-ACP methyl ester carboxylesterase